MRLVLCAVVLAFSGCSRCNPSGGDPKFRSYPAESYRLEKVPAGVAASPDGRWLASSADEEVLLLEAAPSGKTFKLQGAQRSPHGFQFTSDSRHLVTTHMPHWDLDCEVIVWDIAARSIHAKQVIPGGISALAVSSDGLVACGTQREGTIRVMDLTLETRRTLDAGEHVTGLAFLAERLVGSTRSAVACWNAETGAREGAKKIGGTRLAAGPGLVALATEDGVILFRSDLSELGKIGSTAHVMAFSSDGKYLATGGSGPRPVSLYRVEDGKFLQTLEISGLTYTLGSWVNGVAWFDGGRQIVATHSDGLLLFYQRE